MSKIEIVGQSGETPVKIELTKTRTCCRECEPTARAMVWQRRYK